MTLGTLDRPGLGEGRQTGPIALRTSRSSGTQDGQLDIQIANGPELAPEDPEPAELIAHDRLLERAPEYSPGGANPARRDAHGVDLFRVLASDRPRDPGEHPRQVDPENLSAGVGPTIGAGDFGCAGRRQVLEGDMGRASTRHRFGLGTGVGHADIDRRVGTQRRIDAGFRFGGWLIRARFADGLAHRRVVRSAGRG